MAKNRNVLFSRKSKYQRIELRKNRGGLLLKLNGSPQVHSNDEKKYHESFAAIPMMLAKSVKRVVILGGGDGLAAREVLRFPQVESVTLVELDREVVRLCSNNDAWRKLTENAFKDPRIAVVFDDALDWIMKTRHRFDVIIHDVEDNYTEQPRALTIDLYFRFYQTLQKKLKPGGVWVTTVEAEESDVMLNEMYKAYRHTLPPETQCKYSQQRSYCGKNRLLLSTLFPWVKTLTVNLPYIGSHTHFYMSKTQLSRVARLPIGQTKCLCEKALKKLLGSKS